MRRECSPEVGLRRAASRGKQVRGLSQLIHDRLDARLRQARSRRGDGDREGHLPGTASDLDRHSADVRLALAEVRSPAASPYLLELGQQVSTGANAPRGQSLESFAGIAGEELLVGKRRQQDLSAGDTTGRHTGAQT